MRGVLNIGSLICCMIGFFVMGFSIIVVASLKWETGVNVFFSLPGLFFVFMTFGYTFLAFAPLRFFNLSKWNETEGLRLMVIGSVELIVVGLFLATVLFPMWIPLLYSMVFSK